VDREEQGQTKEVNIEKWRLEMVTRSLRGSNRQSEIISVHGISKHEHKR